MAKKSKVSTNWLQEAAVRATRVHFLYVAAFMLAIVIFDSWNLYTHDIINQLWTATGILLVVNTILWYVARMKFSNGSVYIAVVLVLVVADIIFASFNLSWQRGIASKFVALFAIPIVTSAVLRSRSTLLAATTLSVSAYSTTAVRYFFQHYGEAYRVELWGTIGLYSALMFVMAGLLLIIIAPKNERF